MCLSSRYVEFLDSTNEDDMRQGRVSYDTYVQFADLTARCQSCILMDNGRQGDILADCRMKFLRVFVSLKRDGDVHAREQMAEERQSKAPAPPKDETGEGSSSGDTG